MSLLTGYLVQASGAAGSTLYYLTQVDPRGELMDTDATVPLLKTNTVLSCPVGDATGSLPKWVVNRVSQFVAPKVKSSLSS